MKRRAAVPVFESLSASRPRSLANLRKASEEVVAELARVGAARGCGSAFAALARRADGAARRRG